MNSKGFTLVELLITISVLGLILGIAIPSYNGITSTINNRHRNNLIEKIEIAASKYAFDTDERIFFVDKLVTEGYLDSDNDGNVIDPVSHERINCYIIETIKDGDYYNATYNDTKNYEKNGVCDDSDLNEIKEDIYISVTPTPSINGWVNSDVVELSITSTNGFEFDCASFDCYWKNKNGLDIKTTSNTYKISILESTVFKTEYTFEYVYENEDDIKKFIKKQEVKIDREKPIIFLDQITSSIEDYYIETDKKTVTIKASDGSGSGIAGYALKLGSSCEGVTYKTNNTFEVTNIGKYKICVKDKVGNISEASISIINIK